MMHWAPVLSMARLYLSATSAVTSFLTTQAGCDSKRPACSGVHLKRVASFCATWWASAAGCLPLRTTLYFSCMVWLFLLSLLVTP